jgi:hypothetical protein
MKYSYRNDGFWLLWRMKTVIVLFLGLFCGGGTTITTTGTTTVSASTETETIIPNNQRSREDCRQQGFDTTQLACDTCKILPSPQHQSICYTCCQSFRNIPTIQKPYEAAILVIPSGPQQSEEITKFVQDDWEDLVTQKGKHRLHLVQDTTSSKTSNNFFFSAMLQPTHLFFLNHVDQATKVMSSSSVSVSQLEKIATETILLTGWKREDIRDMLQALLP